MTDSNESIWLFKSAWNDDDIDAATDVIKRGTWWAKGPEIEEFESLVARWAGCRYGVAFNSGTSAAFAALLATDVEDGEVIVPSFTFPATANVVVAAGAKPVFADIERESLALDPESVEECVSSDTKAIMPIHFAGDISKKIYDLVEIADENDVPLIEDAAHSIGATYGDDPVGSFGDAAMFSFCFNKVLTTGEGGMIVTDSEELHDRLRLLRSHGRDENKTYITWGLNLRMPSICAAIGVSQAERLDDIVDRRRTLAEYLNDRLGGVDELTVPRFPDERNSVYQLYNLRVASETTRDSLQAHLEDRGIQTRVTYSPVHLTQYYRDEWGWETGDLPVTEAVSKTILTLPFHLDLTEEDLVYIADSVLEFFS